MFLWLADCQSYALLSRLAILAFLALRNTISDGVDYHFRSGVSVIVSFYSSFYKKLTPWVGIK